ncbi:pitrilysin family protein [Mesorhizobium sp. BAC0120]|uniref:M16 family metallopeptidase n=1 Tax=Mesorhizobium sp. BAC0120 TaxID=3090670 RepID=UPI00298D317B|nr:pitrilysin family protein [Mesorhizobium sp. BAC0120]MDW6024096.1 pitrilysin family protein [Mesorhizobium sp. BAC0120]
MTSIADAVRWTRHRCITAALLTFALAISSVASAADQPKDSDVDEFMLDNGMEVVIIPDHRAPVVTHMVWYKIGSADEPPGKSGIAHFFEHLMFKGTTNHKPGEFMAKVAEIGGQQNAFTSYDYTAFYETVSPDALETMMSFEADRMRNLILTDDVIKTERDVVLEERRARIETSPEALLSEEINATLYQNQPYRIPVIGWMHEMEQLNRADAVAFYDRYYAPNNAVLVVAGDVDAQTVKALAEKTYGKVARGPDLPPRIRPTEPEQNTKRTVTMRDARVSVPSFQKSWVVPSYHTAKDGEAEALDVLSEILGGGTMSRIYQELVVKTGIASSAGASYSGTYLDDTSFTIYGAPRGEAGIEQVETAIDAEIRKIVRDGVTESELEKAKNRFVRAMIFARDSQSGMANIYGAALTTGSTVKDLAEWPERIKAVTADQVKAVAAKYLNPDRSVAGYLLPPESAEN